MENKIQTNLIKIDLWSIFRIVLVILVLWFLYLIRDVIVIVFLAGLVAAIITPAVNYFERKKLPRWLGALIVYIFIILILIGISLIVIPTAVAQANLLSVQLPQLLQSILSKISPEFQSEFLAMFQQWLSKSGPSSGKAFFSFLGSVAGQTISFFMVLVIAFYLSVKKGAVRLFVGSIIPKKYQKFLEHFFKSFQKEIGAWGRGLLLLSLSVSILVYLGLTLLGVQYALTLAIIAGLTEFVPYIGPLLALIPALVIALGQSSTLALLVIILYIIVQQIENILLSPYVMHKALGLDPLIVIIVVLIGAKILGPIGIVLAVPITTIGSILVKDYLQHKEKVEVG
ncbi:AI-2E family transporter [Patescibacteria group bacterium AH-259-L07]|nr:AI-2E family transporter [Patescibacteria group bacterium AH-259-L07]